MAYYRLASVALLVFTLSACASSAPELPASASAPRDYVAVDGTVEAVAVDPVAVVGDATLPADRQILREAWASLEVDDVGPAQARVVAMIPQGGFVESSQRDDDRVRLVLRMPGDGLTPFLAALDDIGEVENVSLNGQDVTEQLVDWQARHDNLVALRDRMRQHLDRAASIQELVTVERELARLQTEIDSLAGRLAAVRGAVALSRVSIEMSEAQKLGPLGLVFYGVGKALSYLFVID